MRVLPLAAAVLILLAGCAGPGPEAQPTSRVSEWTWTVQEGGAGTIPLVPLAPHRCDEEAPGHVAQPRGRADVFLDPNRTAQAIAAWLGEPLLGRDPWGPGFQYRFGHGSVYYGNHFGEAFDGSTSGGIPGSAPRTLSADRAAIEEFARSFVEALGLPPEVGILGAVRIVHPPQEGPQPRVELSLHTAVQGQRLEELLRADVSDGPGGTHFRVMPVVAFPAAAALVDPAPLQARLAALADCAIPVPNATMRGWSRLGLTVQGGRLAWVSFQEGWGDGDCEPYRRRASFDAVTGQASVSGGRLDGVLCG